MLRAGWLLRELVVLVLAVALAAELGVAGLAWRLSQGPLGIDWAARRIEAAANEDSGGRTRLAVGHASLEWSGYAQGPGHGLVIALSDVTLDDAAGEPIARVGAATLTLSSSRLALGELVARRLAVDGLEARLLRDRGGDVTLDLGGLGQGGTEGGGETGPTVSETLAELARPARRGGGRPIRPDLRHIEQMRAVKITRSVLRLADARLPGAAQLSLGTLDLRRLQAGGLTGSADATLGLGAARVGLTLAAQLAPDGGTAIRVDLAPVNAREQQEAAPELASADTLDAKVQGVATLALDPALHPQAATLHLEADAGLLRLAGTEIGFDAIGLDGDAVWTAPGWALPQRANVTQARVVVRPPGGSPATTAQASGHFGIAAGRLSGTLDATLDRLAFADIGALWPARLGGHIRPWLVPNITAGVARDGRLAMAFEAPLDLSAFTIRTIDGSVRGDDVTVWWVRPVPPVEGAQARLTITAPQSLDIAISAARQGPLRLSGGLVHITGLQEKDQFMNLDANVQGTVADLVALLRHPRLQLLARKPIPMRNPAGTVAGHLGIYMMLKDKVEFEDVHISSTAHLVGLHLGGLVAGRDLDRGDIQLEASSEALKAAGPAVVGGIPGQIAVGMEFRGGAPNQVVQHAEMTGSATPGQLAAAGLDPRPVMAGGSAQVSARYQQQRDGTAELAVTADLRDAALALPGWKKAPGAAAEAHGTVRIKGDQVLGIDQVQASGPGLAVQGRVEMVGGRPLGLVLDQAQLGATQAQGRITLPEAAGQPIRARLRGAVLDLGPTLSAKPEPNAAPDPPLVADIEFARVLLSAKGGLSAVRAHVESDGSRLTALDARSGAPEAVEARIVRDAGGRKIDVRAQDGGALLRDADLFGNVEGGRLVVTGSYDDTKPRSPLVGDATLSGFRLHDAPALGKLLQALTIYGVLDALSGPGLSFRELAMPFTWDGTVLQVHDAHAFSSSLGLTARGRVDTGRKELALQGTIVPAYVLNSMLGRIPVLGRIFRSESGGGLVAVDYTLGGPFADPKVGVNPLSALTPGFLRGLFHLLD